MKELTVHGTSVSIDKTGILITGKPGSGKSSLALQLIDRGALLVSDDQTIITHENDHLFLSPPPNIKGLVEVRGVGICTFPFENKSRLSLCVELCEGEELERLPDPHFVEYHGVKIPLLKLNKKDPLGMIKVELKVKE